MLHLHACCMLLVRRLVNCELLAALKVLFLVALFLSVIRSFLQRLSRAKRSGYGIRGGGGGSSFEEARCLWPLLPILARSLTRFNHYFPPPLPPPIPRMAMASVRDSSPSPPA